MLVGTILAFSTSYPMILYWPGPFIGVVLFCFGVGLYWVAAERYSPTKYDATDRLSYSDPDNVKF